LNKSGFIIQVLLCETALASDGATVIPGRIVGIQYQVVKFQMAQNQKGESQELHIYFSGLPGDGQCKVAASRFHSTKERKEAKALLTKNISPMHT